MQPLSFFSTHLVKPSKHQGEVPLKILVHEQPHQQPVEGHPQRARQHRVAPDKHSQGNVLRHAIRHRRHRRRPHNRLLRRPLRVPHPQVAPPRADSEQIAAMIRRRTRLPHRATAAVSPGRVLLRQISVACRRGLRLRGFLIIRGVGARRRRRRRGRGRRATGGDELLRHDAADTVRLRADGSQPREEGHSPLL